MLKKSRKIDAKMPPKIDPGDPLKATLDKDLLTSTLTIIYYTSAMSATSQKARFGYPNPPFFLTLILDRSLDTYFSHMFANFGPPGAEMAPK